MLEVAGIKAGDVCVVSAAAGAVGAIAAQIAKMKGATVIGTAGGPDKCRYLIEKLGLDAAIDYKQYNTTATMLAELKRVAPKGIDVYFDNTGGHVTDAVFECLNKFGRVAICGQISVYNEQGTAPLAVNYLVKSIYKSINIRGFICGDFLQRNDGEFYRDMPGWIQAGHIKYEEEIVQGFEKLPEAFNMLFTGKKTGKILVQV